MVLHGGVAVALVFMHTFAQQPFSLNRPDPPSILKAVGDLSIWMMMTLIVHRSKQFTRLVLGLVKPILKSKQTIAHKHIVKTLKNISPRSSASTFPIEIISIISNKTHKKGAAPKMEKERLRTKSPKLLPTAPNKLVCI